MVQWSIAALNSTHLTFLTRWEISTSITRTVTSWSSSWRKKWQRRFVLVWIGPILGVPTQRGLNGHLLEPLYCWTLSGEPAEGINRLEEGHVINEGQSGVGYKQEAGTKSLLPRSYLELSDVFLDAPVACSPNVQLATPSYVPSRPSVTPGSSKMHVFELSKNKRTPTLSKGGGATKTGKTPVSFIWEILIWSALKALDNWWILTSF